MKSTEKTLWLFDGEPDEELRGRAQLAARTNPISATPLLPGAATSSIRRLDGLAFWVWGILSTGVCRAAAVIPFSSGSIATYSLSSLD